MRHRPLRERNEDGRPARTLLISDPPWPVLAASGSIEHAEAGLDSITDFVGRLVRPEAQRPPPRFAEQLNLTQIALPVTSDLRLPVVAIVLRHGAVLRTTMPEAAVDEDHDPLSREGDIDPYRPLACADGIVDTEAYASRMEESSHRDLRPSIATPIRAHAPACSCRDIAE